MRILVTGAGGLVGRAILDAPLPDALLAVGRGAVIGVERSECDVTRAADRQATLARHRPDLVVFCAAFTAVDDADRAEAEAVNVAAPIAWAEEVPVIFLSSNFVFSGAGPHAPADPIPPLPPRSVYAAQKARAEEGVLAAGGCVARVGWVYGPGGKTFASTLARRLWAGQGVTAICDAVVQPTWAPDLAGGLLGLAAAWGEGRAAPIHHLIGRGETSWYGFALAVQARLRAAARGDRPVGAVLPVRQDALGLAAPRPRDARLTPATLPGWEARVDAAAALRG